MTSHPHLAFLLALGMTIDGVARAGPGALPEKSQPNVTRLALHDSHSASIRWAGFSPGGRQVLTAGDDGTVR
jgi:hypothetical protein